MPTTPDATNSTAIAVIVPVVAVVLVVCLLVVCVIATIIILYQRDKHKSPQQQESTKTRPAPPVPYNGQLTNEEAHDEDSVITDRETPKTRPAPPAPYSGQINTTHEEGAPGDYSVITDKPGASKIPVEDNPAYVCRHQRPDPLHQHLIVDRSIQHTRREPLVIIA